MKKCIVSLIIIIAIIAFGFQLSSFAEEQAFADQTESVFVFPSSLQLIDEEAFEGTAVKTVFFPNGFIRIENDAFANNLYLTDIYIPPTTKYISETAFSSDENYIIHGVKESYAEEWAKKHKIPFVEENIWKLLLDNGKTVSVNEPAVDFLYNTVNPERIIKMVHRAEDEDESKRPQDRPELNPIDYRFP